MFPYIIALLFMVIVTTTYYVTKPFKYKKILFCIILFLPLIIICSFKSLSVGNDTSGYYSYYNFYRNNPIGSKIGEVEVGFGIYAGIFGHMKIPFSIFLLISYIIVFAPIVVLTFKYAKHPEVVAFSLFLFQFLNFTISGLRQSIAIGICLTGFAILIINWKEKRLIFKILKVSAFLFSIALAYFFHKSALIFIVVGFIFLIYDFIKINPLFYVFICLTCAIVSPYIYGLIFSLIQQSYHYDPPSEGLFLNIGLSSYFIIGIVVLACILNMEKPKTAFINFVNKFTIPLSNKFLKKPFFKKISSTIDENEGANINTDYKDLFLMILAGNGIFNCMFSSAEVFGRINTYFSFSLGFALSYIIGDFKTKRVTTFISTVTILVLLVYFYFGSYKSGYLNIFPYSFGFYL